MADDTTTLTVAPRTAEGSRSNRRLRRTGLVPGVVYGGEGESIAFQVDERTLRQAHAHGRGRGRDAGRAEGPPAPPGHGRHAARRPAARRPQTENRVDRRARADR